MICPELAQLHPSGTEVDKEKLAADGPVVVDQALSIERTKNFEPELEN